MEDRKLLKGRESSRRFRATQKNYIAELESERNRMRAEQERLGEANRLAAAETARLADSLAFLSIMQGLYNENVKRMGNDSLAAQATSEAAEVALSQPQALLSSLGSQSGASNQPANPLIDQITGQVSGISRRTKKNDGNSENSGKNERFVGTNLSALSQLATSAELKRRLELAAMAQASAASVSAATASSIAAKSSASTTTGKSTLVTSSMGGSKR